MSKPGRTFTDVEEKDIVTTYQGGASVQQLRVKYGTGWTQISDVLKKHEVYEGRKRTGRAQTEQEVCRLYESGQSLAQIAKAFGRSHVWALNILQRHEIQRRPSGMPIPDYVPRIKALREQGLGARKIAKELGIGVTTVQKWLRKWGMATPLLDRPSGPDRKGFRGEPRIMGGYRAVYVPQDDPLRVMAWKNGYALEHRLVMARHLGRPLTRWETVHHKDNVDTADNRIENLQLRQGNHGKGAKFVCLDCGSHNVAVTEL